MRYRDISSYKYQVAADFEWVVPEALRPAQWCHSPSVGWQVRLSPTGRLDILAGYLWDGASGPTLDTPSTMEASLVHDVLYQLMRERKLPLSMRKAADILFRDMLIAAGMPKWRAAYYYAGVRVGGYWSARPQNDGKYKVHVV